MRAVGHGEIEIRMTAPEEMRVLMDEVRGLLVHKKGPFTNAELFMECLVRVRDELRKNTQTSNAVALTSPAVKPKGRYVRFSRRSWRS